MPDAPTPSRPAPISGYRSRAINAVADFAGALRPVAGPGVRVTDGPGGKIIGIDADAPGETPRPWAVRSSVVPGATDPATVDSVIRLWLGPVCDGDGNELPLVSVAPIDPGVSRANYDPTALGLDNVTGLRCARITPQSGPWLVASLAASGYILGWSAAPLSVEASTGRVLSVAVAYTPWTSTSVCIRPLYPGVVVLGRVRELMPFDVVLLDNGHYGVYVPNIFENVGVNTSGEVGPLICDTPPGADGFIDLGGAAWRALFYLQVRGGLGNYPDYHWGVVGGYAPTAGVVRAVVEREIATVGSVVRQYWHGHMYVADTAQDGASIERGDNAHGNLSVQLRAFPDGTTRTGGAWDVDYVVRAPVTGGGPRLDYVAGADIRAVINTMIENAIANLLDPETHAGEHLIMLLGGYFQPLVLPNTTTDGLASSRYVGIEKQPGGVAWEPA